MNIKDLKNLHKGEDLAILGNGLSLHQDIHDLNADRITTIGVNASWHHYTSTYHLALDDPQVRLIARNRPDIQNLIIGDHQYPEAPKNPIKVHMRFDRKVAFSHNLSEGIYVCRSIIWSALQLANHMGAKHVYLLGFDLGGPRIWGHPKGQYEPLIDRILRKLNLQRTSYTPRGHIPNDSCLAQYELMGFLRSLIDEGKVDFKVYISSNSKSKVRSIPRIKYLIRNHTDKSQLYGKVNDALKVVHLFPLKTPKQIMEWMKNASLSKRPT